MVNTDLAYLAGERSLDVMVEEEKRVDIMVAVERQLWGMRLGDGVGDAGANVREPAGSGL